MQRRGTQRTTPNPPRRYPSTCFCMMVVRSTAVRNSSSLMARASTRRSCRPGRGGAHGEWGSVVGNPGAGRACAVCTLHTPSKKTPPPSLVHPSAPPTHTSHAQTLGNRVVDPHGAPVPSSRALGQAEVNMRHPARKTSPGFPARKKKKRAWVLFLALGGKTPPRAPTHSPPSPAHRAVVPHKQIDGNGRDVREREEGRKGGGRLGRRHDKRGGAGP